MGEVEQQTFDAAERELTRKKLIRYAKENGIGAPTLVERITASHPRGTELPLSTLQRFLAGRGKNKSCVALCHHFVERRTISDPSAALGERLFIFYGAANGRDYSGTYRSEIRTSDVADAVPAAARDPEAGPATTTGGEPQSKSRNPEGGAPG
jgi:hypothetical protein